MNQATHTDALGDLPEQQALGGAVEHAQLGDDAVNALLPSQRQCTLGQNLVRSTLHTVQTPDTVFVICCYAIWGVCV